MSQKRKVSFLDKNGNRFKIKLEIKHRNGYPEFTASGESGQCQDSIVPKNDAQKQLIDIWNKWHLNGMNSGSEKQDVLIEKYKAQLPEGKQYDYSEAKEYLDSFTIKGKPISAFDLKNIQNLRKSAKESLNTVMALRESIEGFEKEYKSSVSDWTKTKYPEIASQILKIDLKSNHFYRETFGMQASEKSKLQKLKNDTEEAFQNSLKIYERALLQTALYDIDPQNGKVVQYGSSWQVRPLPEKLWETIESVCVEIERIEIKERDEFPKVVDVDKLDIESELFKQIEEASDGDENKQALAFYLNMNIDQLGNIEAEDHYYGNCAYKAEGTVYYCGTEDEINEAADDYIKNSLWAFQPEFLARQTDLPVKVFNELAKGCENSNDAIESIINKVSDMETFCEAARDADGVGAFLNPYDGTSDTIEYNQTTYHICRAD